MDMSSGIAEAARHAGKVGLRWTVEIDHKNDGGEGGNYPVGWPRLAREFKPGELDVNQYDTLEFWVRIDSHPDEVADDHTPIGLVISSHGKKTTLYSTTTDLGGEEVARVLEAMQSRSVSCATRSTNGKPKA